MKISKTYSIRPKDALRCGRCPSKLSAIMHLANHRDGPPH